MGPLAATQATKVAISGKVQTGKPRDNVMNKEVWTAWLAGLIEGEGTIMLCRRSNKKIKGGLLLSPALLITNTNFALLEKAQEIVTELCGAKSSIHVKNKKRPVNCKIAWHLVVQAQKSLVELLPLLKPYFVGKTEQACLVTDFCKRRRDRCSRYYKDTQLDWQIYWRLREINRRGTRIVETGGQPPTQVGEGTVQATQECVETAEMTVRLVN